MAQDWAIFICHASEDKAVARPLANQLATLGLTVWLDESEVHVGDSLRGKIDAGLARSQFGAVILSPHFFAKKWPKTELDGLIAKENDGQKVILPIWHNVTLGELERFSPILAGRVAVSTEEGLQSVAKKIAAAVKNAGGVQRSGIPIFRGRLTKRALIGFPDGSFLLSNILGQDLTPKISEPVPLSHLRDAYWEDLVRAGVAGQLCYAFEDASSYRAHMVARDLLMRLPADRDLHKTWPSTNQQTAQGNTNEAASPSTQDVEDPQISTGFDPEVTRALIAAGRPPPTAWRPFIKDLRFDDGKYKFKNLDALVDLDHLERLDLFDVEPHEIDALASLKSLRWLYLSSSGDDIRPLSKMKNLEYLNLNMNEVQDITAISNLTTLKHLNLSSCRKIRDVANLNGLTNLTFLSLFALPIDDLAPFKALENLRTLELSATGVIDIGPLSQLFNLQNLGLWKTGVIDLAPLSSLHELRTLDIGETKVKHVLPLRGLTKLQFLDIVYTDVHDLRTLKNIPELEVFARGEQYYSGDAKIDLNEEWQIWFWSRRFSLEEDRLRALVAQFGNSAAVLSRNC